jgi:hypothetical protein
VVEILVGELGDTGYEPLIDLTMMVVLGGRERSLEEFRGLFSRAGFALRVAKPTSRRLWVMELDPGLT